MFWGCSQLWKMFFSSLSLPSWNEEYEDGLRMLDARFCWSVSIWTLAFSPFWTLKWLPWTATAYLAKNRWARFPVWHLTAQIGSLRESGQVEVQWVDRAVLRFCWWSTETLQEDLRFSAVIPLKTGKTASIASSSIFFPSGKMWGVAEIWWVQPFRNLSGLPRVHFLLLLDHFL